VNDSTKDNSLISNPLDNSRPLDVHKWSDYPEVKEAVDAIYEELSGLKSFNGNRDKNRRHLRVVLIDLFHRNQTDPKGYIGYSRNRSKYSDSERYNQLHIGYRPLIRVINGLDELGYIEGKKGFLDKRSGKSRQARMRATDKLLDTLIKTHSITSSMISKHTGEEVIILRDKDKKDIDYKDTPKIIKMRDFVEEYNKSLERTYIDIIFKGYKGSSSARIDLNDIFTRRIFNNSSWKEGGRFYGGWWQNIPRELRERIIIQGKPTVEIDYSAIHIVFLYAKKGIDYFGSGGDDPYKILGYPCGKNYRDLFKVILLTVLNSASATEAKKAIQRKTNFNKSDYPTGINIGDAIAAFEKRHSTIKEYFYSGIGTKLQYYDSLIAEAVIKNFMDGIGIPPLVIHDSFIVRQGLVDELEEVMERELKKVLPRIGGKASTITAEFKITKWQIYEDESGLIDDSDIYEMLASDTMDDEQDNRRIEWNKSGRYPYTAIYSPS